MNALTAWGLSILVAVFCAGFVVGLVFDGFFRKPLSRPVRRVLMFAVVVFAAIHANAQALPEAPKPSRLDFGLYAAEATIRTMDFATTYSLIHNPCNCYHEADPISPSGKNIGTLFAFQYGIATAAVLGSRELRRHGHRRLARLVLLADITSESVAVGRNLSLSAPAAPVVGVRKITEAK